MCPCSSEFGTGEALEVFLCEPLDDALRRPALRRSPSLGQPTDDRRGEDVYDVLQADRLPTPLFLSDHPSPVAPALLPMPNARCPA